MNNGKEISTIVCYGVDGKMKCEYLTAETAEELKKKENIGINSCHLYFSLQ